MGHYGSFISVIPWVPMYHKPSMLHIKTGLAFINLTKVNMLAIINQN